MTEDKMVGWHHQLNGHEFQQAPGDSEGQRSLAYCNTWGLKESDRTEQLNNNNNCYIVFMIITLNVSKIFLQVDILNLIPHFSLVDHLYCL